MDKPQRISSREPLVHYGSRLKFTQMKSQGEGECGTYGLIAYYLPSITCKTCRALYEQENSAENIVIVREKNNRRHA